MHACICVYMYIYTADFVETALQGIVKKLDQNVKVDQIVTDIEEKTRIYSSRRALQVILVNGREGCNCIYAYMCIDSEDVYELTHVRTQTLDKHAHTYFSHTRRTPLQKSLKVPITISCFSKSFSPISLFSRAKSLRLQSKAFVSTLV